jgi:glycosyltransferase involved in cell wall biosynthesis
LRIAIDARAAEVPAGRGRYVRELLAALAARADDNEYALFARQPWPDPRLDSRFGWHLPQAPGLGWPLRAGWEMSRAADVALACTSYAMTVPWRLPGAAIVWDLVPFERGLQPPAGSLLERATLPLALRRAGALIAISQTTRHELEQRFPRARGHTRVATPAADEHFDAAPQPGDRAVLERHGLAAPYVLVTGTLEPRKNLPRVIEAFASLAEDQRAGWKLVLAGAAGWQTDATFASVARHAGSVVSLGYVPDEELPALYRQAGVFAYLSLYEGFGIPVLEAMQSGTAVLTSSRSSMPEVGGDAARYADPLQVADIRRGLGELIADPDLRRAAAAAGIERARAFRWQDTAAEVLEVLGQLASKA